jgi:predicted DNA-binding protein
MARKKLTAFRLDPDMIAGLQAIKDRDRISIAVQVRWAIEKYLDERGIKKAERKRAGTRRRS